MIIHFQLLKLIGKFSRNTFKNKRRMLLKLRFQFFKQNRIFLGLLARPATFKN